MKSGDRWTAWGLVALLALSVGVYARTLDFDFVEYDDSQRITANPAISEGLTAGSLLWAWTTTEHAPYWHPLSWTSHLVDIELYGLNPAGHHASNVMLHLLNVVLIFWLVTSGLGSRTCGLAASALFALHPLHAGSVAWISVRPDLLSTCFALLALALHTRAVRTDSWRFEASALLAFALAILAKPVVAPLPLIVMLWDRWPLERSFHSVWSRLRVAAPWFAVALIAVGAVLFDRENIGGVDPGMQVQPALRVANAVVAHAQYLGTWLLPGGFSPHHLHPYLAGGQPFAPWQIVAASLLLVSCLAAAKIDRSRVFATGWGWFILGLLPVSGLLQVGDQGMADRYLYLPSVGLSLIVVGFAARVLKRRAVALAVLVPLALLGAAYTWSALTPWRAAIPLFQYAIEQDPNDPVMHYNLGVALENEQGRVPLVEQHYRRALEIRPHYWHAELNLANCLAQEQRWNEALPLYESVLKQRPSSPLALNAMGNVMRARGDAESAVVYLRRAVSADPDSVAIRLNLAFALEESQKHNEAAEELRIILQQDPDHRQAAGMLARISGR